MPGRASSARTTVRQATRRTLGSASSRFSMSEVELPAPAGQWRAFRESSLGEEAAHGWPLNSTSLGLENSRVVKSGAGRMYGFGGFNNSAATQFILVFDVEKVPSAGAVPVYWLSVATVSNFGVFWGDVGRFFDRGIVITNSSTLATLTIGAADCLFDAQYL